MIICEKDQQILKEVVDFISTVQIFYPDIFRHMVCHPQRVVIA
jgi:hypothetical protein